MTAPNEILEARRRAELIVDAQAVTRAIDRTAVRLTLELGHANPLLLCVMNGALIYCGRLLGRLHFPLELAYVHLARYGEYTQGGSLTWVARPRQSVAGRQVLVVEDVLDEGTTLEAVRDWALSEGAEKVWTTVLVRKDYAPEPEHRRRFRGPGMSGPLSLRLRHGLPRLLAKPARRLCPARRPGKYPLTMTALISGSGGLRMLSDLPILDMALETPYGPVPGPVKAGVRGGRRLIGLSRHGDPHRLAPHAVNYRANLWLLRELGAEQVLATYTVGAIDAALRPGDVVLPRQIIDYTWGRPHTYDDAGEQHVDFTQPFDTDLAGECVAAAERLGLPLVRGGVYGCTQGPRLETAAEIDRMERDGCTLVGMTAMPEAALARGIGFAAAGDLCGRQSGSGPGSRSNANRSPGTGA